MHAWLLAPHLLGMVLWVGSLLVATRVLAAHCQEAGAEALVFLGILIVVPTKPLQSASLR